jgi:hypothetical protein
MAGPTALRPVSSRAGSPIVNGQSGQDPDVAVGAVYAGSLSVRDLLGGVR